MIQRIPRDYYWGEDINDRVVKDFLGYKSVLNGIRRKKHQWGGGGVAPPASVEEVPDYGSCQNIICVISLVFIQGHIF